MKKISGFTFIHNGIDGGYPIVEAIRAVHPYVDEVIVVDMQSTDSTREVLEKLKAENIYKSTQDSIYWGNQAGATLRQAHNLYKHCSGDIILHFEADEVYSDGLIRNMVSHIHAGHDDLAVYRLQLEQNFQRCRWYPELVHRVWAKNSDTRKEGHTTNRHNEAFVLTPNNGNGILWDITNCFRDNWFSRINQQAELWNKEPQYIMVPLHTMHKAELSRDEAERWLNAPHWTFTKSPFDIPEILKPLVGMVKYEPKS
jgi:glycosyltransferase involved in cell wall biosynthesis